MRQDNGTGKEYVQEKNTETAIQIKINAVCSMR